MNIKSDHKPRDRRSFYLSLGVFLLILSGVFWVQYLAVSNKIPLVERRLNLIVSEDEIAEPTTIRTILERRLSSEPLNQSNLNLYYVVRAKSAADERSLGEIRTLLRKLGWRHTIAQQNLLNYAISVNDFENIIRTSDGLLRRQKFVNEIISLLYLMEINPQTHDFLVKSLVAEPPWREQFFLQSETLRSKEQLMGRYQTLSAMLDVKQKVTRTELARSLRAMVVGAEPDKAWQLFKRIEQYDNNGILFDPNFERLASSPSISTYLSIPFEWNSHSTRGLQISAAEYLGNVGMRVRWNGRGTPLILSQYAKIEVGNHYKLTVRESDASNGLPDSLAFGFRCPGDRVAFVKTEYDKTKKESVFFTNQPVNCHYPRFEVQGQAANIARPIDVTLFSIHIAKNLD